MKERAASRSQIQSGLGGALLHTEGSYLSGVGDAQWTSVLAHESEKGHVAKETSTQQKPFSPKAALGSKAFPKPVEEVPRAHIYAVMTSCKRRIPLPTLFIWGFQGLLTSSNQKPFSPQHSKTLCEIKIVSLPNFLWVNYCSSCAKLSKKKG